MRGIKINFEPWFPKEKLPRKIHFYLSSEHNSYTITFGKMMNGKILTYVTQLGKLSMMGIKAGKFISNKLVNVLISHFGKYANQCLLIILALRNVQGNVLL